MEEIQFVKSGKSALMVQIVKSLILNTKIFKFCVLVLMWCFLATFIDYSYYCVSFKIFRLEHCWFSYNKIGVVWQCSDFLAVLEAHESYLIF